MKKSSDDFNKWMDQANAPASTMSLDAFTKHMESAWDKTAESGRSVDVGMGKGGAIKMIELTTASKMSEEDKAKMPDGLYMFTTGEGLKYIGYFNPDMPDGEYVFEAEGKYSFEKWSDGQRIKVMEISEEDFNIFAKLPQAKEFNR